MPRWIQRIRTGLDSWLARVARRRASWSSLYYGLFSRDFHREHQAVLEGKRSYQEAVTLGTDGNALLRRNTHRLEKGLLMRPRKPTFALDYIEETVRAYERLRRRPPETCGVSAQELTWAHDVLAAYFAGAAPHPLVDPLRQRFLALPKPPASINGPTVPYRRDLSAPPPVSFEQFRALARRRRSVRWFLPRPVPRELLDQALEVAAQSPSACNRQPFVFRVFDQPDKVREVVGIPYGTQGYRDNVPVIVVLVGRLRCFLEARDRHLIYIDGALAAMGLVYALETLGLATCVINWPDLPDREEQLARLLEFQPDERPILLVAVGYPDPEGLVASSVKKPLDELRSYNR